MKRLFSWQVTLGLILVALSVLVYCVHYLIFKDFYHIAFYLVSDIAFVFIEVLLVTIVLHEVLHFREKKAMLKKLNMVIGAFFSEVGLELLRTFSSFDKHAHDITGKLVVTNTWSHQEFAKMVKAVKAHEYKVDAKCGNLEQVRDFLKDKRQFLLGLLENPNLLEHESFTNLLWAVFHLTEELISRRRLKDLPEADYQHLSGDIRRVYHLLISEWLEYMEHLKNNYPYLFSLAMRTNPFDAAASVEVKQ